jgi:hypothetical protein
VLAGSWTISAVNAVKDGALMGMIQKNSDWEHKTSVKKGNLGEQIVNKYLESKNFIVYRPVTEKAHAFDILAVRDKKIVIIGEVKTKALMNKWKATGFNNRNFLEYQAIHEKYKLPIFIFFVDENMGSIYGNWLHILEKPYYHNGDKFPMVIKTKGSTELRLYHYDSMKHIAKLNAKDVAQLASYTRRNYEYTKNGGEHNAQRQTDKRHK